MLAASLVSSWSAAAQDLGSDAGGNAGSFYASGDAGVAILQNITSYGSVTQYTIGPKVDMRAGYNFTENIAVEIQGGFAHNDIYRVNGSPLPPGFSADIWTVPVMANGIYRYAFNDHWQAYGGLGAGGVITTQGATVPPQFGVEPPSTDCTFGYQALLGIKYRFNDHLECGLGYSFLGSLDHRYTTTVLAVTSNQPIKVNVKSSPTYMHSIVLSLTYKF